MSSEFFQLDLNKAKGLYKVKKDKTSIDKFVNNLNKEFGDILHGISVRGLTGGNNNFYFKQLPYGFEQKAVYWEAKKIDDTKTREYYLKLYVNYEKHPFYICNMNWVSSFSTDLKTANEKEFNANRDYAFRLIEKFFKKHTKYFLVSVFCGVIPGSSWSTRCYIKVIIKLPVSGIDVFTHCGIGNLTDFGQVYYNQIKSEFCNIVDSENYDLANLFKLKREREKITRAAENIVRKKLGLKNVGDSLVNETLLANLTKKIFPDTIRQFSPKWIGKFQIDLFIPSLNIAVEYNGVQHYKPIERFGGEEKFIQQQKRDEFIREKCKEFNVTLLEWHYNDKINEKNVYEFYSKVTDIKEYKRPLTLFD